METNHNYILIALQMMGSLSLLIYGMRVMSEALQKMAGPGLRHVLARMTTNRFTGMLTGMLVTCAVQSSSADIVAGHLCYHGCQHRNDPDSMDYVTGIQPRFDNCYISLFSVRNNSYLHKTSSYLWWLPVWHSLPVPVTGVAEQCRQGNGFGA